MNNEKISLNTFLNKIKSSDYKYMAAALAAVLIFCIIHVNKLLTGGENTIIGLDMEQQYFPFILYLKRVFAGESSLWYSWGHGLGQGIEGTLAYYTFSPINIIYLILPSSMILEATEITILIKVALAALFMQIFLKKFLQSNNIYTVIFAVCYSLCSYQIVYYSAINLVDSIYLFPLLMLGILELINKRSIKLLIFIYSLLFAYNFYMGYIIGICSFICGISYYIYTIGNRDRKRNFNIALKYVISVIISLALTAIIWLPAVCQLLFHKEPDLSDNSPFTLNPFVLLNNLFGAQYQSLHGYVPYIYCGILSFLLLLLFFAHSGISKSIKLYALSLIVIFTSIMCIKPLNDFMHAFDSPQSLGYRYSFVFSFIICVIGCFTADYLKEISLKEWGISLAIMILIYSISMISYNSSKGTVNNSNTSIFVLVFNIIFIIVYISFAYLFKTQKLNSIVYKIVLITLVSGELLTSYSYILLCMGGNKKVDLYNAIKELETNTLEYLPSPGENEFYRVQAICLRNSNIGDEYNINSVELYDNFMDSNVQQFMKDMGLETYIHHYSSRGMDDILRSILSVRYMVNFEMEYLQDTYWPVYDDNENMKKYHETNGIGACPINHYPFGLSLGFMSYGDVKNLDFGDSPFENQNLFISQLCGEKIECFNAVEPQILYKNSSMKYDNSASKFILSKEYGDIDDSIINDDDPNYMQYDSCVIYKFPNEGKSIFSYFNRDSLMNSGSYLITNDYNDLRLNSVPAHNLAENYINELGMNNAGEFEMILYLQDYDNDYFNNYYFNQYNEDEFNRALDILSRNRMSIDQIKNSGYLRGNITVDKSGVLFLSIPYSKGFKAYVDGVETEVMPIVNETFCGLELSSGKHIIEMKYTPTGLYAGSIISSIALISIAISYLYFSKIKRRTA